MKCFPSVLDGTVKAIPSKSDAHRKLICAALSENGGTLPLFPAFCDDIAATIRCLRALGAEFSQSESGLHISPIKRQAQAHLDCGESGSTLRFLLPVAMAVCGDISVTGGGRLPSRPIDTLTNAMSSQGVHFFQTKLPLHAAGQLIGGVYDIAGNVSSQFLSGLLMALPLCEGDSEIHLTTSLQSSAYVDMTLDTLKLFGVQIHVESKISGLVYHIKGNQKLHMPENMTVDGDWSNAAFWLAAGALSQDSATCVTVSGLDSDSRQGDKQIVSILQRSGARITVNNDCVSVCSGQNEPLHVSMEGIPDLLPILAVQAALSSGKSEFSGAERLRLKESDRLQSVAAMLSAMGGQVVEYSDGLTVFSAALRGGKVDAQNDHRLVMAAAIAALNCTEPVMICGAESVNKSYPNFFLDYIALGGKAEIC